MAWNLMWNHDHVQGVYWLNEEEKKRRMTKAIVVI